MYSGGVLTVRFAIKFPRDIEKALIARSVNNTIQLLCFSGRWKGIGESRVAKSFCEDELIRSM